MTLLIIAFWSLAFLLALPILLYPVALCLLSRLWPREQYTEADGGNLPSVDVLLAVRNEESVLERRISNLLEQDYPGEKLRVLVGSDDSSDRTDEILASLAAGNERIAYTCFDRRLGKPGVIMKLVEELAEADALVFTDADTIFDTSTVRELVRPLSDPRVGCVDGFRRNSLESESCESVYWRYEKWLKTLASRAGAVLGATGAVFALRRKAYAPISPRRGDDFELAVMSRARGYRCVCNPLAVAFEPTPDDSRQFSRLVRITSWMAGSAFILLGRALSAGKLGLALQLLIHKILRWQGGFILAALTVVAAILAATSSTWLVLCLLLAAFHLLAVIGLLSADRLPSILRVPCYFWLMFAASSLGMIRFLLNKPVETWDRRRRRRRDQT